MPAYRLGPEVLIRFSYEISDSDGWWCPEEQVLLVDANLRGHELAVTLLHEIGHMICADHGDVLDDTGDHDRIEEWAEQCASLLDILRPGRRAVPA